MLRGRTLVFTIAAAAMLLLAAGSSAFPPALFVGGNINITKLAGSDAEGLIVVNPVNPDQLFFTVNGFTARRSIDGGFNWTSAASGIDPAKICCDNVAVWDDFGNLFLADLNLKPGFVVDTIPFFYSVDGGASFKTGKSIYKGDVDQPAIDAGGGADGSKRSVWVTWNTAGTIYASGAEVKGLGKVGSWSKAQAAPGSATIDTGGQFGDVAVGPDGQVLVELADQHQHLRGLPLQDLRQPRRRRSRQERLRQRRSSSRTRTSRSSTTSRRRATARSTPRRTSPGTAAAAPTPAGSTSSTTTRTSTRATTSTSGSPTRTTTAPRGARR